MSMAESVRFMLPPSQKRSFRDILMAPPSRRVASPNGPLKRLEKTAIYARKLSFFSAFTADSIDFGWDVPMFRHDAARYRNAML
jgi:hypothetical protein